MNVLVSLLHSRFRYIYWEAIYHIFHHKIDALALIPEGQKLFLILLTTNAWLAATALEWPWWRKLGNNQIVRKPCRFRWWGAITVMNHCHGTLALRVPPGSGQSHKWRTLGTKRIVGQSNGCRSLMSADAEGEDGHQVPGSHGHCYHCYHCHHCNALSLLPPLASLPWWCMQMKLRMARSRCTVSVQVTSITFPSPSYWWLPLQKLAQIGTNQPNQPKLDRPKVLLTSTGRPVAPAGQSEEFLHFWHRSTSNADNIQIWILANVHLRIALLHFCLAPQVDQCRPDNLQIWILKQRIFGWQDIMIDINHSQNINLLQSIVSRNPATRDKWRTWCGWWVYGVHLTWEPAVTDAEAA